MHKKVLVFLVLPALVLLPVATSFAASVSSFNTVPLSAEDIAALAKPSVVMIDNQTSYAFETDVPQVDLNALSVTSVAKPGAKPVLFNEFDSSGNVAPSSNQLGLRRFTSLDDSANADPTTGLVEDTGSGYIISSDGYIVTNAHVASTKGDINDLLDDVASQLISEADQADSQQNTYDTESNEKQMEFHNQVLKYLLDHMTVLTDNSTLTVFDPSVSGKSLAEAVAAGFPATIVTVNDNYPLDGKDVAVIKIGATNLPTLPLDPTNPVVVGSDAYLVGFPSTATITATDYSDASLSKGVINAVKNDGPDGVAVYETDAKMSPGSSGSPMLDAYGAVIGMATYGSGSTDQGGDSFGYAIPISLVVQALSSAGITITTGTYYKNALAGILDTDAKHCQSAAQAFSRATDPSTNNQSFVNVSAFDAYQSSCKTLIASGQSLDSGWEEFVFAIKNHGWLTLMFILLAANLVVEGFLFGRLLRDERKIKELQFQNGKIDDLADKS